MYAYSIEPSGRRAPVRPDLQNNGAKVDATRDDCGVDGEGLNGSVPLDVILESSQREEGDVGRDGWGVAHRVQGGPSEVVQEGETTLLVA